VSKGSVGIVMAEKKSHPVVASEVYAFAHKLNTGPFRLFSMAYDAYACPKNVMIDDYYNFITHDYVPLYVQSYVIAHRRSFK
jgi:hypothetical protein